MKTLNSMSDRPTMIMMLMMIGCQDRLQAVSGGAVKLYSVKYALT